MRTFSVRFVFILNPLHRHTFPTKLLKADFHGCILTGRVINCSIKDTPDSDLLVTRSKCPSNVGTTGIMIQETEGTFQIVTRDNKLKGSPALHPYLLHLLTTTTISDTKEESRVQFAMANKADNVVWEQYALSCERAFCKKI